MAFTSMYSYVHERIFAHIVTTWVQVPLPSNKIGKGGREVTWRLKKFLIISKEIKHLLFLYPRRRLTVKCKGLQRFSWLVTHACVTNFNSPFLSLRYRRLTFRQFSKRHAKRKRPEVITSLLPSSPGGRRTARHRMITWSTPRSLRPVLKLCWLLLTKTGTKEWSEVSFFEADWIVKFVTAWIFFFFM